MGKMVIHISVINNNKYINKNNKPNYYILCNNINIMYIANEKKR